MLIRLRISDHLHETAMHVPQISSPGLQSLGIAPSGVLCVIHWDITADIPPLLATLSHLGHLAQIYLP